MEFLDGVSYVGYGLAARFSAKDGNPTYYGLFVCQSGEFMLLRVIDGKETVLQQWTASALLKPNQPNRIELELAGSQIKAYLNGELAATVQDEAIAQGGYALLAGPGVAARLTTSACVARARPGPEMPMCQAASASWSASCPASPTAIP